MTMVGNQYRPDYAIPPGWMLEEELETQGMSQAELSRRCGRSAKLISEIIAGKAPLEPETALQFEKVLGTDASVWLGIEAYYRLHQARVAETQKAAESASWARAFPVNELVKRGFINESPSCADIVSNLLAFFGVASVKAWQIKYDSVKVAYHHSPSFQIDPAALATWLRLGELEAEEMECADYNETGFRKALKQVRQLTPTPSIEALEEAQRLCRGSGVALVPVKPLPKTALSGAAWWLSPRRAVIQLSARHKTDDHLWYSLFHEAAHILLHSKKMVFVEEILDGSTEKEAEANRWAADFLVNSSHWKQFVGSSRFSEVEVRQFAAARGIAAGIVVGRLQHEGRLPWNRLNHLKVRLQWQD